jgi:hypothetical protein
MPSIDISVGSGPSLPSHWPLHREGGDDDEQGPRVGLDDSLSLSRASSHAHRKGKDSQTRNQHKFSKAQMNQIHED